MYNLRLYTSKWVQAVVLALGFLALFLGLNRLYSVYPVLGGVVSC